MRKDKQTRARPSPLFGSIILDDHVLQVHRTVLVCVARSGFLSRNTRAVSTFVNLPRNAFRLSLVKEFEKSDASHQVVELNDWVARSGSCT
jgi:hypothetical protein